MVFAFAIEVVRIRKRPQIAELRAPIRLFLETEQPVWLRVRQRLQQHAVYHGEHHGGCPAAERKRQQSDSREAGPLAESAKRIAKVLPEILQPARASLIAALLLHLLRTTQSKPGLSPCFHRIEPSRDQIVGVFIEVETQFLFELFFHL